VGYGSYAGFTCGFAHASFTTHAAKALSRRRTIPIELPEFAIRALEHRVEMTNAGADEEEMVSFNDPSTRWRSLRAG
jgi:hypothetical protein